MSEEYDISDDPCEKCGHPEVRRAECSAFDCDDGYYHDCMEDCCCCANPIPNRRCDECGGHGVVMWCPHCGWEPLRKCYMNGIDQRLLLKTPNHQSATPVADPKPYESHFDSRQPKRAAEA